jgi:hypothetical protein
MLARRPQARLWARSGPVLAGCRPGAAEACGSQVWLSRSAARSRRSPGLDAVEGVLVFDSQSHVHHEAAACHAPDGVEVGLGDLGDLREQEGEPQDELAQRFPVERSAAPQPVQLGGDALGGVDQLVGFCVRLLRPLCVPN